MSFFKDHRGLIIALLTGIPLAALALDRDKQKYYADFFDRQANDLSDAVTIARQELHDCPEAARLIDENVSRKHPGQDMAGIEEALRDISKRAGLKVPYCGDDWPDEGPQIHSPKKTIMVKVKD